MMKLLLALLALALPASLFAQKVPVIDSRGQTRAATIGPDQSSRWVDRGIVLTGVSGWESNAVGEPSVIYSGGQYLMFYSGGGGTSRIGRATSPDGLTFTRSGVNPVVGGGYGGESGLAARCNVVADGSTLYMTYSDLSHDPSGAIYRVQSTDAGVTWTNKTLVFAWATIEGQWGNRRILKDGSTWYMLNEVQVNGTSRQEIALYSASSVTGSWTRLAFPLNSMNARGAIGGTSTTSPGGVIKSGSRYYCWPWCTMGFGDFAGTEIYSTNSLDLINWAEPIRPWRAKDTTYLGAAVVQHADVSVVEVTGRTAMYHTILSGNGVGIGCRDFAGSVAELVAEPRYPERGQTQRIETTIPTPDYYSDENFAWIIKRSEWTGLGGYGDKLSHIEGVFYLKTYTTDALQIAPPPAANSNWVVRCEGGMNGMGSQQYISSGAATLYYGSGGVFATHGSGAASGGFRYQFNTNFAANAGDTIVMSPSGHTFTVDVTITNATTWSSATAGGVFVRNITAGSYPTTSDTSLTVNGGAPISTTFQKNSATNGAGFDRWIFFSSSTGIYVYSPVYGGSSVHYTVTGY